MRIASFMLPIMIATTGSIAIAQSPGQTDELDPANAFEQFRIEHPGTGFSYFEDRISRVYGKAFSHGDSPSASAESFRIQHAEMFGVAAEDLLPVGPFEDGHHMQQLTWQPETDTYKFSCFYYTQHIDNIPVYNTSMRLLVRNEPGYPLVLVSSDLRDVSRFEGSFEGQYIAPSKLNKRQFLRFAGNQFRAEPKVSGQEMVIWAGVERDTVEPRLAITFVAQSGSAMNPAQYIKQRFVVDAKTAQILHQETMIHNVITGTVEGMATDCPAADICLPEFSRGMPYARVTYNGNVTYADANGTFIVNDGGNSVQLSSEMRGQYFRVFPQTGSPSVVTQTVPANGAAVLMHNAANTNEFDRAQVNAYYQANIVRDAVIKANPNFPQIADQSEWTINTGVSGSCNAFYDGNSINFYNASGGCSNTSNCVIVHHEFGHHVVNVAGSGQGAYGEGYGDTLGVVITDEPKLAIGFFTNDCEDGIRNADNDCDYTTGCSTCGSAIHTCGQLLSGCFWETRNFLILTNPDDYLDILQSWAVNMVLLHNGTSITPDITIDVMTLDDNDGDILNGTPNYAAIQAGFSDHNMPGPDVLPIAFSFPTGHPELVNPSGGDTLPFQIEEISDTVEPGSIQFFYRNGGSGSYQLGDINSLGGNQYEAVFAAADCPETVEYYLVAETGSGLTVTSPSTAPSNVYGTVSAASIAVVYEDNFDVNDPAWSVSDSAGLVSGSFEQGIPITDCNRGNPTSDSPDDGVGCYLTWNSNQDACNTDIDDGTTTLISPTLDASGGEAYLSYWRWFSNVEGASPEADVLEVEISNDGLLWVNVETVGPTGPEVQGGWFFNSIRVADFIAPNDSVRIRFIAGDLGEGSVVEAAIDGVSMLVYECDTVCEVLGDLNGDCVVDGEDLGQFLAAWGQCNVPADLDNSGCVDGVDLGIFLAQWSL